MKEIRSFVHISFTNDQSAALMDTKVPIFRKLSEAALEPVRGSPLSAGVDLKTPYMIRIGPNEQKLCKTDLSVIIPSGFYGQLKERSGLAKNTGYQVKAGVIDRDYTGNIGVIIRNTGPNALFFDVGDVIVQMVFIKCLEYKSYGILEYDERYELPETSPPLIRYVRNTVHEERGNQGFGSTSN